MFFDNERKQKERQYAAAGRLPPGQSLTLKWPVLHEGDIPRFDPATWDFQVRGLVQNPLRLTWQEFLKLPQVRIVADFHCVTTWSKFDNEWTGVSFRAIAEMVKPLPEARYVMVHADPGYTTNVPLDDLMRDNVLFATGHAPDPFTPEHGAPLRLVVPHLYAWKSAKWVRGLAFLDQDRAGYWERVGYHMYGDPFKEQRYHGQ
ncbi:MAG: sulfite oxidase-like oxidoreductase [Acidobacteria bacterium]|nr:sulfite oxidase-like oxidoreductase [Acidobacteriota bacterium]